LRLAASPASSRAGEILREAAQSYSWFAASSTALGESEEREQLVAALTQARHHARAASGPRALEGRVSSSRGVSTRGVHDAMEVVPDLGQHVLRRFPLKVAELESGAVARCRARPCDPWPFLPFRASVPVEQATGPFPPPPHQTVREVLPHTAYRQ